MDKSQLWIFLFSVGIALDWQSNFWSSLKSIWSVLNHPFYTRVFHYTPTILWVFPFGYQLHLPIYITTGQTHNGGVHKCGAVTHAALGPLGPTAETGPLKEPRRPSKTGVQRSCSFGGFLGRCSLGCWKYVEVISWLRQHISYQPDSIIFGA